MPTPPTATLLVGLASLFMLLVGPARAQPDEGPVRDRDGDGYVDEQDGCPDEAEDRDLFEDHDGCPDDDNDKDLVPDTEDACGQQPETRNGHQDDDGCPDVAGGAPAPTGKEGAAAKTAGDEAWKAGDYAGAAGSYRQACALGDVGGCGALAIVVELGHAKASSPGRALALHRFACGKRVRESCHNLGLMTRDGRGVPANPAQAKVYLGRACDLGLARSCELLGRQAPAAPAGTNAPVAAPAGDCADAKTCDDAGWQAFLAKRYAEAARHGQRGCDLGAARACAMLGLLYDKGHGVAKDPVKGLALARKACAAGHQSGCHNLAYHLEHGDVGPKDLAEARRLYDGACKSGLEPSCDDLARLPKPDPLGPVVAAHDKQDYRGAEKLAKPLCDGGDPNACAWLGLARWELGRKRDAVTLWDRACEAKVGWACREAGRAYWDGEGASKDEVRGVTLAVKGCELDDGDACFRVGLWTDSWSDPDEDFPAGAPPIVRSTSKLAWMRRACELRSPEGCREALLFFESELRDPASSATVMKLARIACDELHNGWRCVAIGRAYCDGVGVARDREQCRRYLDLGCKHGIPSACSGPD